MRNVGPSFQLLSPRVETARLEPANKGLPDRLNDRIGCFILVCRVPLSFCQLLHEARKLLGRKMSDNPIRKCRGAFMIVVTCRISEMVRQKVGRNPNTSAGCKY